MWTSRYHHNHKLHAHKTVTNSLHLFYLSDRNILVDDPKIREFAAFDKEAIYKIEKGQINTSRTATTRGQHLKNATSTITMVER